MSLEWRDNGLAADLRAIKAKAQHMQDDLYVGAKEQILPDADERTPKRSGYLVGTGLVKRDRGGDNTVGITFDGPYARWVHEHLHFKHPAGGEAKFLETAMLTKGRDAINKAGEHFWERL